MKKLLFFSFALLSALFVTNSAFTAETFTKEEITGLVDSVRKSLHQLRPGDKQFSAFFFSILQSGFPLSNQERQNFILGYREVYKLLKNKIKFDPNHPAIREWTEAHESLGFTAPAGQLAVNPAFLQ